MTPTIWRLKGTLLRFISPIFFERIGKRTQFTGRIRLPMPFRKVRIGTDAMIGHDVFFQTGRASRITIGDHVSLNSGCHLVASDSISIGDNVAVGEYVSIRDQEHKFTPATGVRGQGFAVAPIVIGDSVWIGRGVYIGPGTHIGDGCIVAANSVVRGRFPPRVLIAGAPARIRRQINEDGTTSPLPSASCEPNTPPQRASGPVSREGAEERADP